MSSDMYKAGREPRDGDECKRPLPSLRAQRSSASRSALLTPAPPASAESVGRTRYISPQAPRKRAPEPGRPGSITT